MQISFKSASIPSPNPLSRCILALSDGNKRTYPGRLLRDSGESKRKARRYNKSYPGEMVHFDTKRLPRLKKQTVADPSEYLFVAIDDYSRELYAAILPDHTASSAAKFLLRDAIDRCPYTVGCAYSDNGVEYKGNGSLPFGAACRQTTSFRSSPASPVHKPTAKPSA
uniref:DDE-type integrase/transposase/recombinase n=1 Tax=Neisseria chenwenguii TaxID=1853278 RepID=UPI001E4F45AB|nr:DDE-type integrase/transposase/recombinase [Neisseria chenwenguii]